MYICKLIIYDHMKEQIEQILAELGELVKRIFDEISIHSPRVRRDSKNV